MIVVMAQDFVSVRLELDKGLDVMSACREIPGATAVNVVTLGAALCLLQHVADSAYRGWCVQLLRAEKTQTADKL